MKARLGLSFEAGVSAPSHPNRTDIACFVGAVARRPGAVPESVLADLAQRGYRPGSLIDSGNPADMARLQTLAHLPVLCDSFADFDALYAWDQRPLRTPMLEGDAPLASALGAAVRAFFGEGGQRCYIVRTGDPAPVFATPAERLAVVAAGPGILRGVKAGSGANPLVGAQASWQPLLSSAAGWRGLEVIYALLDVSFVALPDLVDACAAPTVWTAPDAPPAVEEVFHASVDESPAAITSPAQQLSAPLLDADGFALWRQLILLSRNVLDNGGRAFNRADVQLIASLPRSSDSEDLPSAAWWSRLPFDGGEVSAARLQLAYPWISSTDSRDCPGTLEAPEGSLLGVLARSALRRGSFRTAAGETLQRFLAPLPALDGLRVQRETFLVHGLEASAVDRVCLMLPTPRGPALISDTTLASDPTRQPGSLRRLVGVILRKAAELGGNFAFEANGERLWQQLRERLGDFGRALAAAGALDSDAGSEAFSVRCGTDTMSQNDIDAGRLIAQLEFTAAQPVTRIIVRLSLRDAGTALASAA